MDPSELSRVFAALDTRMAATGLKAWFTITVDGVTLCNVSSPSGAVGATRWRNIVRFTERPEGQTRWPRMVVAELQLVVADAADMKRLVQIVRHELWIRFALVLRGLDANVI